MANFRQLCSHSTEHGALLWHMRWGMHRRGELNLIPALFMRQIHGHPPVYYIEPEALSAQMHFAANNTAKSSTAP